jgi:Myb-like DNA-binding domain
MKQVQQTLKQAIVANRRVQTTVKNQLQKLARQKVENRRLASQLLAHVTATWHEFDRHEEHLPDPSEEIIKDMVMEEAMREHDDRSTVSVHLDIRNETEDTSISRNKKPGNKPDKKRMTPKATMTIIKKTLNKWKYNSYRRWERCFFVDPNGSIPEPNADTIKRRAMEQGQLFFHTHPPWTHQERKDLKKIARQHSSLNSEEDSSDENTIDWKKVAESLQSTVTLSMTKATKVPRTPEECRLVYRGLLSQTPFSKKESLATLEQIHSQSGRPSWRNIKLDGRTTWQIFCNYQMKLSNATKPGMWTIQQDEFLLKYLAAMGPQYILSIAEACRVSRDMLHDKSPKVIMSRANQTLLNPNLARSAWTIEEDMTVALCMKIYQEDSNPLVSAGKHLPMRASQSITAKWHRSLNPQFSTLPWTPDEDQRLIQAAKICGEKSWTDIAVAFPDRNPRTIQARWTEVASSEDLLKKYGEALRKREARGTLLSAKDFVLRVKSIGDSDFLDGEICEVDDESEHDDA